MIYIGKVTRVQGTKVHVTIEELGGDAPFGPLNVVVPAPADTSLTTATANGPDPHTHGLTLAGDVSDYYSKGDRVVVAQIGAIKEDLIVIGKVA
jgi:hypothetical protein